MQRSKTALLAALLAVVVAGGTWRLTRISRIPEAPPTKTSITAPAPADSAPKASSSDDLLEFTEPSAEVTQGFTGFDTLSDGRKVPELPADAPKRVSFGVIVVAYRGAESAPDSVVSKPDALSRAKSLVHDAVSDFEATVKKGDRGSTTDAGSIPRGIVEPAVEYVLFTLKKGDVYGEPVDTPRGYWIVKRNQ